MGRRTEFFQVPKHICNPEHELFTNSKAYNYTGRSTKFFPCPGPIIQGRAQKFLRLKAYNYVVKEFGIFLILESYIIIGQSPEFFEVLRPIIPSYFFTFPSYFQVPEAMKRSRV